MYSNIKLSEILNHWIRETLKSFRIKVHFTDRQGEKIWIHGFPSSFSVD